MAPTLSSGPRPRAGVPRRKAVAQRIPGSDRRTGSTPFRASTPVRQTTPLHGQKTTGAFRRECPRGCTDGGFEYTDDLTWICTSCGAVVEAESQLVAETQFAEGPSGQVHAQGVTIGNDETHRGGGTFAATGNAGRAPTPTGAQAQANAKVIIQRISNALHLSKDVGEAAERLFKMAYTKGFVRGRTLDDVSIVCLYLATRQSHEQIQGVLRPKHPYMLIDFAERGDIDVFALGRIYVDLCRELFFDTNLGMQPEKGPILAPGPEVFVERFVRELEFPKHDERRIMNDAYQIVASMRRDWITRGRRPAGVCGAAVILAARMNNYRRTLREVVLVAKVTEITLNKRLEEFSGTRMSKVSVSDFRGQELPPASDAHLTTRDFLELQNKRKDRNQTTYDDLPEPSLPPIMTPKPKKRKRKTNDSTAVTAAELEGEDSGEEVESDDEEEGEGIIEPATKLARLDPDGFRIPDQPASSTPQPSGSTPTPKRKAGRPKGSKNWRAPPPSDRETALEQEIEGDIGENMPEMQEAAARMTRARSEAAGGPGPTPPATDSDSARTRENTAILQPVGGFTGLTPPLTDTDSVRTRGNTNEIPMSPTLGEDEFEDDPDVSTCVLNEEERRLKEMIWVNENADWLRQDHAKRIRRQLRDAELREKGIDPAQFDRNKKAQGRRRKDGSKVPGRAGDVAYLTNDEYQRRGENGSSRAPSENDAPGSSRSGSQTPDRALNAADSVSRMLGQRAVFSRRLNMDAVKGIYSRPSAANSPTPSESRASSVVSDVLERRSMSHDQIAMTSAERRRRIRAGLPADADRSNVIFGGVGGKNTGLARSKASLSAERRQLNLREQSRGSGSPSVEPSGRQQSADYEESVASVSGSSTPPPGPSRTQIRGARNVSFAKSPPQQRSAPGSGPHTPASASSLPSTGMAGAGEEEEVVDEVVGERSLIREVAPPGAYVDDDEDDDMEDDEDLSDEDDSEVDPEDAFAGNVRARPWEDDEDD